MRISAVIFDMDGLMLDTERVYLRAWQQAMADFGGEAPADLFQKTIGLTSSDTTTLYLDVLGKEFPVQAMRAREQDYFDEYIAHNGAPIKPGLLALLDLLDNQSLPKAVASSTALSGVQALLDSAGIGGRFPVLVGGDEVEQGKPAPDIFLLAAQRLGIPAQECLVLEDSEAGILAAHTAGMNSILVPDLKAPSPQTRELALHVMPGLEEVTALLTPIVANATHLTRGE
jgi:HAD superfamily hydrolase (TIGR01509 family)